MRSKRNRMTALVAGVVCIHLISPPSSLGDDSSTVLKPGAKGRSVKRLQVRVAGWYPGSKRKIHFALDGVYGRQTRRAVRRFQRAHGLRATGVVRRGTRRVLHRLRDRDGSTAHFDWWEFVQNRNRACSARANAYAGTFGGGMVSARRAKRNVRRLMWRLEAVRKKGGGHPIGVNSGFRSVAYNDCIGGARLSQHMFGTAADNRMARVRNRRHRKLAKRSAIHGIGCYRRLAHNHFDIRIDNPDSPSTRSWWWPERDRKGRDLDASGRPCWGQSRRKRPRVTTSAGVLAALRSGRAGTGSLVPAPAEVRAFAAAGEPRDLHGQD